MKIAIGNDHAATDLKFTIMEYVKELGHEVINFGTDGNDSCDYPEFGEKVGRAVVAGEADCGILICGTGVGISIAANKVNGVRAAVCSDCATARLVKEHNNANVLAFGARIVGSELAKDMVKSYIDKPMIEISAKEESGIQELEETFRVTIKDNKEVLHYAGQLQHLGARNVIVSLGSEGAVFLSENGQSFQTTVPKGTLINSVGAGDSMIAGFLTGWFNTQNYENAFRMAVATGSASAYSEELATKDKIMELLPYIMMPNNGAE